MKVFVSYVLSIVAYEAVCLLKKLKQLNNGENMRQAEIQAKTGNEILGDGFLFQNNLGAPLK